MKILFTASILAASSLHSTCGELPFTAPDGFKGIHTGFGDEGSSIGKLINPNKNYVIRYSFGGTWIPKRGLRDNKSLDSIIYFSDTLVNGADVIFEGYKVDKGEETTFRIFMRVYSCPKRVLLITDFEDRDNLELIISDYKLFTFKIAKKSDQGAAHNR